MIDNKMPFYNFVNILIAGFVLVGAGAYLFWTDVKDAIESILLVNSIGVEAIASLAVIAIAYEIGYIVFRLGAIAIEPIIRLLDNRRTHDNFAAAQNKYPVLGVLSREYAYARTRIMLFFIIAILSVSIGRNIDVSFGDAIADFGYVKRVEHKKKRQVSRIVLCPENDNSGRNIPIKMFMAFTSVE